MPRDDEYNQLLRSFIDKIPSECDAYESVRKSSRTPSNATGAATFKLTDFEAYRNDIEFVNAFPTQLFIDEENYFVKKYSRKVYNYLLSKRSSHSIQKGIDRDNTNCASWSGLTAQPCKIDAEMCESEICLNHNRLGEDSKNKYVDELLRENPVENPSTILKKAEYRSESHTWLSTINRWITYLYFAVLIGLLLFLFMKKELKLSERFMVYFFLIILPFLFPYLFELLAQGYLWIFPNGAIHGPKNAFLDTANPIDSYNI
jgi:hypothetical protein